MHPTSTRPTCRAPARALLVALTLAGASAEGPQRARAAPATAAPTAGPIDSAQLRGMEWRNIGPHRGGRVMALAGVPSEPPTFLSGAAGGTTRSVISPDLSRRGNDTQGITVGPITNGGAGGEGHNTSCRTAPLPNDARTIRVGTDNGLMQATRDGGAPAVAETTLAPPRGTTLQDAVNFSPKLLSQVGYTLRVHEAGKGPATSGVGSRAGHVGTAWLQQRTALQDVLDEELATCNIVLRDASIQAMFACAPLTTGLFARAAMGLPLISLG